MAPPLPVEELNVLDPRAARAVRGKAHSLEDESCRSPPAPLDVCTKRLAVRPGGVYTRYGMEHPLRRPAFRHLAAAYTVNELGNWLGDVALAVVVFDHTGSALAVAALFLSHRVVGALAAPALVSRLEPLGARPALRRVYVAEALVFAALAPLAATTAMLPLIALAALDGALALAGRALVRAATAALAGDLGQLRRANAVLNMGMTGAAALGPAAAGLLVAGLDASAALLVDAASFLLVAAVLPGNLRLPGSSQATRWRVRLAEVVAYVRRDPTVRGLLGVQAVALVFFTAVIPVEVVFAKATLDAGDAGYGLLLTVWGVGMVGGGALFAALPRIGLHRLLAWGTLAIGVAYAATAAAPSLAMACVAAVLGGVGNGVQWIALVSAVQQAAASAFQARTMAVLESVAAAMPALGFALGGAVATLASPRATYAAAAVGAVASAAAFAGLARARGRQARARGPRQGRVTASADSGVPAR
jgi:MFS family permease